MTAELTYCVQLAFLLDPKRSCHVASFKLDNSALAPLCALWLFAYLCACRCAGASVCECDRPSRSGRSVGTRVAVDSKSPEHRRRTRVLFRRSVVSCALCGEVAPSFWNLISWESEPLDIWTSENPAAATRTVRCILLQTETKIRFQP